MKCETILEFLEEQFPKKYACEWDNPGLLTGRRSKEIHRILVALDATKNVINKAISERADLIVTHHPMIFQPIKSCSDDHFVGQKVLALAQHEVCCFATHTNFDVCAMGDLSLKKLGLHGSRPVEITYDHDKVAAGIGRIADLDPAVKLSELCQMVKKKFSLKQIFLYGDSEQMVSTVAVVPGSGRNMMESARELHADVIITGDIGHHEGLDAMDMGMSVIDAGHYGLEHIFIDAVADRLEEKFPSCQVIRYDAGCPFQMI